MLLIVSLLITKLFYIQIYLMNTALLGCAAFFAYGYAAIFLGLRLQRQENNQDGLLVGQFPAIVGFIAHSGLIVSMFMSGIHFAFFNSLALFAWIITGLLILSILRWPLVSLGILVYPIAGLCAMLFGFTTSDQSSSVTSFSLPLQLHIISSVFAYSMLSLAALQAIMLAIQDHQLHHHNPNGFVRSLPPLQTMERLMFRVISTGFILLSLVLVSGFIVIDHWFTHKTIFSIIAWLIFASLLLGRWKAGWRGRKVIHFVLSGISFLVLAFFGSKLVFELILGN